ncbi:MAG: nucleoside diphosphate kinase regulator [Thermoanaerobaculia bacterium]
MTKTITISEFDRKRLLALVDAYEADALDRGTIQDLLDEIERARIVPSQEVPPGVITMNTRLRLTDTDAGASRVVTVVFPGAADADAGKVSILAPLGTALLGYSVGDVIEWAVPGGLRHYRIEAIEYQPEAAGDWRS